MNPHHNSNQNPAAASAVQQVNSVINQQLCNGNAGGLYPNTRPIVAPSGFMNFPNQPFPLQNTMGQFPNGIGGFNPQQNFNPFPVNQFNPSQQQQGQFFAHNSMNPNAYNQNVGLPNEQVILQNTIQNICQLLQLQNRDYTQCPPVNFPMFQNQIANVMGHQNPGFHANQQFGLSNANGPVQHANQGQQRFVSPMDGNVSKQLPNMGQQLQGNPFLPHAPGSVQTQQALATVTNFQIAQGMGPQNHSYPQNQLFGMANSNGPGQPVNQGQQRFVAPMMDVNASRQIASTGQQGSLLLPHPSASVQKQNPCPTLANFEDNHGNIPANGNAKWTESQRKNFTGHKRNDLSHKGFKSQFQHAKHVKEKFGTYNGNTNKEGNNNAAVNSGPRNSTNQIHSEKKYCVKYTEQEVKQWREARKKHYPSSANVEKKCKKEQALSDVTNQGAMLRRQQLKEILTKQAELGCEVADIPSYYLSVSEKQIPRGKKHEREQYKKGKKFRNKRGTQLEDDDDRITKKTRPGGQDPHKPKQREPSLLQKLLTRDIKRDKTHLLQVFRFIAANSFFTGERHESLRFPSVIVRETNADVASETTSSVCNVSEKAVDVRCDDGKCNGEVLLEEPEEEGEITD
ncbi:putative uncharacterized protein DDB_G0286901 isoform X2 [Cynara cardunculus var. scolymus]|uniref:putative uncharacterized protein DDB_G0286901 isoform X2 n=1 Tax=Cynara cardunculus var. scolymus TaxID=59895 RepID=UPI000D625D1D|nr:putative uncharacterized protein DDB_G0286901 isoform X2 [Cynara cardunculus var. scolymus]